MINPGLAPWALQEYRPLGAHCPTATINPPNPTNNTTTIKQIQKYDRTQQFIYTPQNAFNEHNTITQHRKRPIRQRALKGRYSCIAQGEMRAKPDMEPWGHADKRMQRALQGRHSRIAQGEMRAKPDMKPWGNTANTKKSPARATLLQSPG